MISEGKFGPQEAICLITITISAGVFYTSPSTAASLVGTAVWYMTLISAASAAVGLSFIYLLLKKFPGKDIIQIFEITLGRLLGFIFSALLAMLMVSIAFIRAREFAEIVSAYVLPRTPLIFILALFIGAVAILNILGLETIARLSKLFAYVILAGFVITLVLAQKNYSFHRIFPIFGYGIDRTLYNGIIRSSVYGEVIILAVFAPCLQGIKYIKKAVYTSLILSGLFISMALLAFIMTFSFYTAIEMTSPMYEMAKLIDYGRFIQGVEPVFLFIMVTGSLIAVSSEFYAFVSIYCKMFRMQDTRPVILAAAIIIFWLAISLKGISDVVLGKVELLRNYSGLVYYIPPLISLIAAKLAKKGETNDA